MYIIQTIEEKLISDWLCHFHLLLHGWVSGINGSAEQKKGKNMSFGVDAKRGTMRPDLFLLSEAVSR